MVFKLGVPNEVDRPLSAGSGCLSSMGKARREFGFNKLYQARVESSSTTGQPMLILAGTSLFGWGLTVSFVPQMLTMKLVVSIEFEIVNIVFLIARTFIDGGAAIMTLAPLLSRPASHEEEFTLFRNGRVDVMQGW